MRSAPLAARTPLRYRVGPWATNTSGESLLEHAEGEWVQFSALDVERTENVSLRKRLLVLSAALKSADAFASKVKSKAPEILAWEAEAAAATKAHRKVPERPVLYWQAEAEGYLKARDAVGNLE